jgi:site-specific DNA-methyltransferase (adenine-specific)
MCRKLGFDNLNPIIWHKIANANFEVNNGTKFLGKPYEPNAIIKNDIEFILMQRKAGGYRKPTERQRDASRMTKDEYGRGSSSSGTSRGPRPRPIPRPSRWNWRIGWCGCSRSWAIPFLIPSWALGPPASRP